MKVDHKGYNIYTIDGLKPVTHDVMTIKWDMQSAQKGGYRHFMLKEIFEQPRVIVDGLTGRVDQNKGTVLLRELDSMGVPERLHIVACGTSYHAGLWGRYLIENWAQIPVHVEIAALRIAKKNGVPLLGLCNVVGSSIAREADSVLYTQAGPEISVASTKAMCSQMLMLCLMALYWSERKGVTDPDFRKSVIKTLLELPGMLEKALPDMHQTAKELSRKYARSRNFFYLGRGHCYPMALEGALKLKELSYIHAEGYAAGEMKHGPIALIDQTFPTFALALKDELLPKVVSNIVEIQARQGHVITLTNEGCDVKGDDIWIIPDVGKPLTAFFVLPALQLFSYETSDYLGKDVDQPRNLAKSVTVE